MGKKIKKKRTFGKTEKPMRPAAASSVSSSSDSTVSQIRGYDYSHYSYITADIKRIGYISGGIGLVYLFLYAGSRFLDWF